jgi:hypothetical protein
MVSIILPLFTIIFHMLFSMPFNPLNTQVRIGYYIRYSVLNMFLLALLFVFHRPTKHLLANFVSWLYVDDHHFARRVVFFAVFMVIFTFQTRAHLGFWYSGISGWTYADYQSGLQMDPPITPIDEKNLELQALPFLEKAVATQNAIYLPHKGYLTGKAMFLHFQGGEVLPANYELTDFVFPQRIFGVLYERVHEPQLFFEIVRSSLKNRRQNRQFLLPSSISYPNHAPYMRITYETYPPAASLDKISFWTLTIFINEAREVQIVSATEELIIDAP